MKPFSFLVTLILGYSLTSCSSFNTQNGSRSDGKPLTSLDAEALAQYQNLFDSHYVQCGDSYYTRHTWKRSILCDKGYENDMVLSILQLKDVSFFVISHGVGEAEKLNGYEWKGAIGANYKAGRYYEQDKGWSEWESRLFRLSDSSPNILTVTKKNGAWQFGPLYNETHRNYNPEYFKKISCSEIPQ